MCLESGRLRRREGGGLGRLCEVTWKSAKEVYVNTSLGSGGLGRRRRGEGRMEGGRRGGEEVVVW